MGFGYVGAQRAAHLHGADRAPRGGPAAEVIQQLAQRDAERLLHQPAALEVAGQLDRQRAARAAHAEVAVVGGAARQDHRQRGQRDHVVDHGRLAEQALDGRQRRTKAHLGALALQALQQRRLLPAHVGASAQAHFQIEVLARSAQVAPQVAAGACRRDRLPKRPRGMRVFAAQVDVALRRADGDARDGHALDEAQRIALHEHAIGERARIALIRVADDVLLVSLLCQDRLPLDARRERSAAASAQARVRYFLHDRGAVQRERALESLVALVRHVVLDADRVGDADPCEGQALLPRKVRDVFHATVPQRVRRAVQQPVPDEGGSRLGRDGAVGDALALVFDLDERLQPDHAA